MKNIFYYLLDIVHTFVLLGQSFMQTISSKRIAIPARHNISPISVPAKNTAIMNDNAAITNRTI